MATYDNVDEWIRTESDGDDSTEDQLIVARWFADRNVTVPHDRVARTSEVEDRVAHRLEYQVRTSLDNLEGIGVLVQFDPPGSGRYIRHHRREQNFFDPGAREYVPLLEEEISRFLDDLASRYDKQPQVADGGDEDSEEGNDLQTLREVAAAALEIPLENVEDVLSGPGNEVERMNRFDSVVKAIKESEVVSRKRNYDEMGWRNTALRWSLSERAAHMEANHSLT